MKEIADGVFECSAQELAAIDSKLREAEIAYYRAHPEKELPCMVPVEGAVIHWPKRFK